MENYNFICPVSGKQFMVVSYRTTFENGRLIYKNNQGGVLINPENLVELQPIEKEIDWSKGSPITILGNDKSSIQKRSEQLKQRSKDHYKKEISEVRYQKNKELIEKFKE